MITLKMYVVSLLVREVKILYIILSVIQTSVTQTGWTSMILCPLPDKWPPFLAISLCQRYDNYVLTLNLKN